MSESMLLRLAIWQYRIANDLSIDSIAKAAGINSPSSLSRFLSGSSNDGFEQSDNLKTLLSKPIRDIETTHDEYSNDFFYNLVSLFFCNMRSAQEQSRLNYMAGRYEAYQWSSTRSGKILISDFHIFRKIMPPEPSFFNSIEIQKDNDGSEEIYRGCCVFSSFCAIFVMHDINEHRPKFIICDNLSSNKYRSGLVLKRGTTKNLHLTPICLKKVEFDAKIEPTIVNSGSIDDKVVMNILNERMTPFNPNDNKDKD